MKLIRSLMVMALILSFSTAAYAQRGKLEIGKSAPGLDIDNWYNAEAVTIESDKIFVILFFKVGYANNPPIFSLLNEIQTEFADEDVHVVAVSSESDELVTQFASQMERVVKFPIAVDRRNSSDRAWMKAASVSEYPGIFIVDKKSRIQFIGSPFDDNFAKVLALVANDRYDAQLIKNAERFMKPAENARRVRNYRQCFMHLDKVIELDKRIFANAILLKFEIILLDQQDPEAAYAYASEMIEDRQDDPTLLKWLVEMIVLDPRIAKKDRNLDIAMQAAQASYENSKPQYYSGYALLALVHFHRDELREAIEWQKKAWRIARPKEKPNLWRDLMSYKDAARRSGVIKTSA